MKKNSKRVTALRRELVSSADEAQARVLQRFFKTNKGEYGEGDIFLGIKTPVVRNVARRYITLELDEIGQLLESRIHEERACALALLVKKFEQGDEDERKKVYDFYLQSRKYINNWDLVDLSAPHIVGRYLLDKDRSVLYRLAHSEVLWDRRIAMLSAFTFIRDHDYADALLMAETLLCDEHDLMHKAVGWMLREIGKRDRETEEAFLNKHYRVMPRTMLRYAIEKFDEPKRRRYMEKGGRQYAGKKKKTP
jgi:3-methyladenine DNA glycosylase AlkD